MKTILLIEDDENLSVAVSTTEAVFSELKTQAMSRWR
jgi:hypothetical protein